MESEDKLYEKLERFQLENEVGAQELNREQQKAQIKELKKRYGRSWRSILALKDNESLRQFGEKGGIRLV